MHSKPPADARHVKCGDTTAGGISEAHFSSVKGRESWEMTLQSLENRPHI